MTATTRILVPLDSYDEPTFRLALGYAKAICEQATPPVRDVILLVHTKNQLSGTSLSRFLGPGVMKALTKGPVALAPDIQLRTETLQTLRFAARASVIVAYYADLKMLDAVDALHNVEGVVAVPDIPGEANGWVARWGARVHGQAAQAAPALIEDPLVIAALESVTTMINLGSGLGHPRDKAYAEECLRILRTNGHADPSATIKSWAIRRGWSPSSAGDLEKLTQKIWALKTKPRLSGIYDAEGRYARWREEC